MAQPKVEVMDVTLYRNFSVPNKLNKNLTQVAKYTGVQVVNETDDFDVSIRMTVATNTLKWDNVNYFEWDGAYYYLESVTKTANSISTVNGRMDVLMTYLGAVNALNVRAVRSTSNGSGRLEDTERAITADSERTVVAFPNVVSGSEAMGCYVVTTSQSGYTLT